MEAWARTLEAFCAKHRSRLPSQYAFDLWPRAFECLDRFDAPWPMKD
jgi:hypothetical protein